MFYIYDIGNPKFLETGYYERCLLLKNTKAYNNMKDQVGNTISFPCKSILRAVYIPFGVAKFILCSPVSARFNKNKTRF